MIEDWSHEETDDPLYADRCNFYKVDKWSRDGQRVEELLFAGNSRAKAQRNFESFIKRRPRSRLAATSISTNCSRTARSARRC